MPASKTYKTPGVYVVEHSSFPPSIVGVETAVPAFIGYTEKAEVSGKPVLDKPIKIQSLADYENIFGSGFRPVYGLAEIVKSKAETPPEDDAGPAVPWPPLEYDFRVFDPNPEKSGDEAEPEEDKKPVGYRYYDLTVQEAVAPSTPKGALAAPAPEDNPRFNLYNSLRLFYDNGGGTCYVVSVGLYTKQDGKPNKVEKENLTAGLVAIAEQRGPTMLVVPDAVLLPNSGDSAKPWVSSDFNAVATEMLQQCEKLQDRVALLDVYGSNLATPSNLDDLVEDFRTGIGDKGMSYGASYFPFLDTSVVPAEEVDYQNVDSTGAQAYARLKEVLTWQRETLYGLTTAQCKDLGDKAPESCKDKAARSKASKVQEYIDAIGDEAAKNTTVAENNRNLVATLPLLKDIERLVVGKSEMLPPSGAMAGIYTFIDGTRGVWNAPANVSLASVVRPTFKVTARQQEDLNVPVDGKAIDAIREFQGKGTVVWGARTLDGNSNDYRYIQVRRTLIYIEQSIKASLDQFVFAANDGKTWATVVSMVSGFLQGLWSQGGLMGATASEAFTVDCGLGSTMTGDDILNGYMVVQVTLQLIRPAEFIELTFKQKMEGVA